MSTELLIYNLKIRSYSYLYIILKLSMLSKNKFERFQKSFQNLSSFWDIERTSLNNHRKTTEAQKN